MRPTKCKKCKHEFINYDIRNEDLENKNNIIRVICPECGIEYCNKSKTERDLFHLQDSYISGKLTKDTFITKSYSIIYSYTRSIVLGNFRNRLYESDDLENYTSQAVHYFYIYFLADDDFVVTTSFSGLIYHKIVQALNEKSNIDSADYSIDFKYDDGNEVSYEDKKKNDLEELQHYDDKSYLLKYILDLIFHYENECNNKRENFVRLQAIYLYLKYGEKKADSIFKQYNFFGRTKFEETKELLYKELLRLEKESEEGKKYR